MGMWGFEAWDNDFAADWFGDLVEVTDLRNRWLAGINADVDDNPEVVRAALWLFVQLGRTYIWPIDHLGNDLELAIKAAEYICNVSWLGEEVPDFVKKVQAEREELITRRR